MREVRANHEFLEAIDNEVPIQSQHTTPTPPREWVLANGSAGRGFVLISLWMMMNGCYACAGSAGFCGGAHIRRPRQGVPKNERVVRAPGSIFPTHQISTNTVRRCKPSSLLMKASGCSGGMTCVDILLRVRCSCRVVAFRHPMAASIMMCSL